MVRIQSSEFRGTSGTPITELRTLNSDHSFLHHAIRLGARGLGRTWPNPSVGCVLVQGETIIATATTAETGRPHAETQALQAAGDAARGATAYVSLEPCAHHGATPPCAQALIDAGIARVVIAATDPDPRVSGQGMAMLRAAGIAVELIALPEAAAAHRGFFSRLTRSVPYVAMKLATSLDGQMTDHTGNSRWITGAAAREHGHSLRSSMDAMITGIGTVLADDPMLTARAPAAANDRLVRVVCDRRLRLPLHSRLVATANQQPLWVMTTPQAMEMQASHATDLREAGVKFCVMDAEALSPTLMLQTLAKEGITRALVEAGGGLSTTFLQDKAVDTLYWYRAPIVLGNTGASAIAALNISLAEATRAHHSQHVTLGTDICDIYELGK